MGYAAPREAEEDNRSDYHKMSGKEQLAFLASERAKKEEEETLKDVHNPQKQTFGSVEWSGKPSTRKVFGVDGLAEKDKSQLTAEVQESNTELANNMREAGKRLLNKNPKKAMELLEKADKLDEARSNAATSALSIREKTFTAKKDLFSLANDQDSWNLAKVELAKLGTEIPLEYTVWNDKTKQFVARQALLSGNAIASTATGVELERLENTKKEALRKQDQNNIKAQQADVRIAHAVSGMSTEKGIKTLTKSFSESPEFDGLSETDAGMFALRMPSIVADIVREASANGEVISTDKAQALAIKQLQVEFSKRPRKEGIFDSLFEGNKTSPSVEKEESKPPAKVDPALIAQARKDLANATTPEQKAKILKWIENNAK
jgi:hypothetical protein